MIQIGKKIINLGKVKGRTLDLKVDNKVLKKKYDDEIEWQELGKVGGIDAVNTVNDLPADAEQDDISFVKEADFVETVEYQEEAPIVLQGGGQTLNIELRQEPLFLSEINFEEIFPEFSEFQGENGYMAELGISGINGETSITTVSYPASFTASFLGIEQSVDMYQIMHYGNDDSMLQYHKLRGMSIKDYMMGMAEIPATEEQMQILFGEHYNDKTEDNPSYEWMKVSVTEEPINENSVFLNDAGAYVTLEFNAIVDLKGLSNIEGYYFSSMKMGEEYPETELSIEGNLYDIEEYEKEEQDMMLKFGNILINAIYSGGLQDISYDVYTQKGFHKFDEEWKSLEEDMNIPKVVDTYSDLPKSFIENGLMAVSNEEVILPEPTHKTDGTSQALVQINPTPSVENEIIKLKRYFIDNGAPTEIIGDNYLVFLNGEIIDLSNGFGGWFSVGAEASDNFINGIHICMQKGENIESHYCYFIEDNAELSLPDKNYSQQSIYKFERNCWYYYEIEEDGKHEYLNVSPQKLDNDDWFPLSNNSLLFCEIWAAYTDDEENWGEFYSTSYEFDSCLRFYNLNKVETYPQGFYKYSKNRWYHQPDIAGASFDNEDLLKSITEEDIGNIELNTEARHTHNNKSALDNITWTTINNVANNTDARHTHSNKSTLDKITETDLSNISSNTTARHTHSNKTILDKVTQTHLDNAHTHSNKTVLDSLTRSVINSSHSHSNSYYLDLFTSSLYNNINSNTNARHTHSNKSALDNISNTTINDITNNTSARHSHTNKTVLDKVTQEHLDNTHTHENKELLDNVNEDIFNKSHNHDNADALNKFSIDGDKIMVDGRELQKGFKCVHVNRNTEGEYEITPQKNTLYWLSDNTNLLKIMLLENDSYYINNCLLGEFWFYIGQFGYFKEKRIEFHFDVPTALYFTNNVPDDDTRGPLLLKLQRTIMGYNVTWYSLENTFYKMTSYGTTSDEKVFINTQGVEYNYNYGLLTERGLEFAPAYLEYNNIWYINAGDVYLEAGYQRLYGNTKPINPLPPNTYEEMKVHQVNDLIIVERNYLLHEVCSGNYINSDFIKDFTRYFAGYTQEEFDASIIGELDLRNGKEFTQMFADSTIKRLPTINLQGLKDRASHVFVGTDFLPIEIIDKLVIGFMDAEVFDGLGLEICNKLKQLSIDGTIKVTRDLSLGYSSMSIEPLLCIFEALEDNTDNETQYTIYIGIDYIEKLTEEQKAIVTNKNLLLRGR